MSDENAQAQDRLQALQVELDARTGEAEWLKNHYEEQLRAAFAQIAQLQARTRGTERSPPAGAGLDTEERAAFEQLKQLVAHLTAAEARYLDRIAELKEELAHAQG